MKIAWVISEKHATQKWQIQSDFYFSIFQQDTMTLQGKIGTQCQVRCQKTVCHVMICGWSD